MAKENICGDTSNDSKVILVSCSGMCVHGQISREAVHKVIYEKVKGQCDWICPIAIPAEIDWQINRLKNAKAIIAVPGCPMYCDVLVLEKAGYRPTAVVDADEVCDFKPGGMELDDIPFPERQELIVKLADVIEQEVIKIL